MRRNIAPLVISAVVILFLIFQIFPEKKIASPVQFINEAEEELQQRDEVLWALRYEFRMTADPALNRVPRERLRIAEQQMKLMAQQNQSLRFATLSWTERGPNNVAGRTRAILIDKNDVTGNTVWAAGVGGGLWKTTNFKTGSAWTKVDDFFSNLAISCIVQDHVNPQNIYFGTGEGWANYDAIDGVGIWKSSNSGGSWTQLGSTTGISYVQDMIIDDYGNVYATTRSTTASLRGVIRSNNGGTSWTQVLTDANTVTRGADLERATNGDIYATLGIGNSGSIWKSSKATYTTNIGASGNWANITPTGTWQRIEIGIAPSNTNKIYALLQSGTGDGIGGIRRSDDGGANWNTITPPAWCDDGDNSTIDFTRGNQAWYDLVVSVDPTNDQIVYIGGIDVLKSVNQGTNWSQITQWRTGCTGLPYVHADIHEIQFFPGSGSEIIVGSDGGLFYTTNAGTSFTNKNTGYNVTQYYGLAVHPSSGNNTMLAGAQDNGTHLFSASGINTVTEVSGGDGGFCFIDQTNGTVWITSFPGGTFRIFRNSGTTIVNTVGGSGRFIGPADYANNLNVLYFGENDGHYMWVSNIESGALSGTSINFSTEMGASRQVSCVKVDPADETTIWLGCSDSENNTGAAVTPLLLKVIRANSSTAGPPATRPAATVFTGPVLPAGSYISNIDIESTNSNHMLLTVSNFGVQSVWESTDGGTNWTSVEGNLPDMPVRWGLFTPSDIGGVMLATELGVWSTAALNGASTVWTPDNSGLANVRTDMLVLRSADKLVAAGTHGRGVFTTFLFATVPVNFTSFTGKADEKQNKLNWKVENEVNNKGYEVERKYHNENGFSRIGFVPAKNNGQQANEYSFNDPLVDLGKENASYRLKQIDIDGKFTYSTIVVLARKPAIKFIEYVSVNAGRLLIRMNGGDVRQNIKLDIYDEAGKLLKHSYISCQTQEVDVSNLPKGIFIMDVSHPDGRKFRQKIMNR